ncbi:hypothetical protein ARTHRO9V_230116 [Arthrobacter sp. 9V]|nr:hypothetical protein ARTHRO9V_230116 [Arthrobacter sp. 9V]
MFSSREAWVRVCFVGSTAALGASGVVENLVIMRLGIIEAQQKRKI